MLKKLFLQVTTVFIVTTFFLAGCSSSWRYARPAPSDAVIGASMGAVGGAAVSGSAAPLGAVIGGVAGGIIGHCLSLHQSLVEKIQRNGVRIIQVGDTLTLLLPSDRFFADSTPVLNRNYYTVLDQIASLLRSFDKFSIKVSGYTDNHGWPLRNVALSRAQAFAIANYLWSQGIDTRMMSSIGYGDATPIADNNIDTGRAMNRRVEISLRMIAEPDDM
jgi:outer membrane protein OmpA-like peptidoglycan-associated protein